GTPAAPAGTPAAPGAAPAPAPSGFWTTWFGKILAAIGRFFAMIGRWIASLFEPSEEEKADAKPKVVRSIPRVGTEAFKRDSSGNIISRDVGSPVLAQHVGAPHTGFKVQPVQLQLADGSWVDATRSLGKATHDKQTYFEDHRMDADCHG